MSLIWICFLFLPSVSGHLIVTPLNHVTTVGSHVTFHCQTNISGPSITWSHTPIQKQLPNEIRPNVSGRYYVTSDSSSGQFNFTLYSVTLDDAGVHAWSDDRGFGTPFGVELVVIQRDPSCETNATRDGVTIGDVITFFCRVSYRGNLEPKATWEFEGVKQEADFYSEGTWERLYTRTITANTSDVSPVRRFSLNFRSRIIKDSQKFAVNDPTYNYVWTSPEVVILFPVSNLRVNVTGTDITMYVGETISCSALGNPEVRYLWQENDVASGALRNVSVGRHLMLVVTGSHKFRCVAENIIRGRTTRATSEEINIRVLSLEVKVSTTPVSEQSFPTDNGNITTVALGNFSLDDFYQGVSSTLRPRVGEKITKESTDKLFFISTLALGSVLFIAFVIGVVFFVFRKNRRRRKKKNCSVLSSKEHYLLVPAPGFQKTDHEYRHRSSVSENIDPRSSDIYDEIDESHVTSDVICDCSAGTWNSADDNQLLQSLRRGGSLGVAKEPRHDDFVEFRSDYITCPATLHIS